MYEIYEKYKNEREGEGPSPEADHQPCQPIHYKAHQGLDNNWLSFLDPVNMRTT